MPWKRYFVIQIPRKGVHHVTGPHREAARLGRGSGNRKKVDKSLYWGFPGKEWARQASGFKID